MTYPFLQWPLIIVGDCLEILVFVELLRSGLFRRFPAFFALIAWQVARIAPSLITYRKSWAAYSVVYWFFEIGFWLLLFLIILELYEQTLREYPGLSRLARVLILWSGAALLIGTVVSITYFSSRALVSPTTWLNAWMFLVQRSIRFISAGLLATLVVFLAVFRVPVAHFVRYLMFGWLISSASEFVGASLHYELPLWGQKFLPLLQSAAFVGVLGVWLWALRKQSFEETELFPRLPVLAGNEQVVLSRLAAMNSTLTKVFRQ